MRPEVEFRFSAVTGTSRNISMSGARARTQYACLLCALGTDQLFVKICIGDGHPPVEVVIPCSQYAEIFSTTRARDEYHHLLSRCQGVHRLPFDDCSEDAYLATGHWIVDHSDLVMLVWNGYPAAGRGGTADIASYHDMLGVPLLTFIRGCCIP